MMALPEIKSLADLKGKTVGVTRFGSSTDFALRYLMQKQGFNADKDVTISNSAACRSSPQRSPNG